MRICDDKRSIYNGENKTKEEDNILVSTADNLFCAFIINGDENIVLRYFAIKMKNMHTYELRMALSVLEFSK